MRANKGLGRSAARNLRIAREEKEAANTTLSPYHARRLARAANPSTNTRTAKVVVYESEVKALAKILGRRRVTAHRRRKLANHFRDSVAN